MSDFEAVFLLSWQMTPTVCSFIHPLSMPCQDHKLSVYMWFCYATTKNDWSFQTILTRRQNCLLGGMLVALRMCYTGMHEIWHIFLLVTEKKRELKQSPWGTISENDALVTTGYAKGSVVSDFSTMHGRYP